MRKPALKNGWTRVAFGDVVQLSRERSGNPAEDGLERYVGLDHIEPSDLKIRRWGDIAEGTTFTNVFHSGQILFGKRRAYQRKVAVADFDGVCSGDIYVLEPKNERLLPTLLPFICQTDGFFQHAVGTSAGSLSPRTNWESLASYEFALPPLDEQQRLTVGLHAIAVATESLKMALARAKDARQSILFRLFTHDASVVERWQLLRELTTRINDGTHQPPTFAASGIPFLLVSNVTSGRIDWTVQKYVSPKIFAQLSRVWRPHKDDVLYSLVGSYGVPAMVDRETLFTFQRHIGLIRPNPNKLLPKFLYWYLSSPSGLQQARLRAEGLAQKTITLEALRTFRIPAPTLERQREVVLEADALEESISSLEDRVHGLRSLERELATVGLGGGS